MLGAFEAGPVIPEPEEEQSRWHGHRLCVGQEGPLAQVQHSTGWGVGLQELHPNSAFSHADWVHPPHW